VQPHLVFRCFHKMSPTCATSETGPSEESIQTILVVEDEVLIRLPLAEYLRDCGYRVFEASSVAEAKAVLNADTSVDLVFSDVNMPGNENGFALATWIRQRHPDTKVLLTSGIANATRKAEDLCEDGPLLAKPYSHDLVVQRIQSLLD
jgi:CheY-like chemotaxis protein